MIDLILIASFAALWLYSTYKHLSLVLRAQDEINVYDVILAIFFAIHLRLLHWSSHILRPLQSLPLYKRTPSP